MDDVTTIITDFLQENEMFDYNNLVESLINFLDTDTLVDWFVYGYFARDFHDIYEALGKEKGKIIEDYYDCHCS